MFWIVVAEVAVMFGLFYLSWRVYEARRSPAAAVTVLPGPAPSATGAGPPEVPSVPLPAQRPAPSPVTGFPVDLPLLNRSEASLEKYEAGIVAALVDALRAYVERVVLPAVGRAERASAATSAAATQSAAATRKIP